MKTEDLLLERIKLAPSIVIFSHHFPDGDCLGSAVGLKKILQANFPDKPIYHLAEPSKKWEWVFGKGDEVSDELISKSLGIVVDHNSHDRVCDKRIEIAGDAIRFDHHLIGRFPYEYPAIVDADAVSASQVILLFCLEVGLKVPVEALQDLYVAFIDDSLQYGENNKPACFESINNLFKSLGGDEEKAKYAVHFKSQEILAYERLIAEKGVYENGLVYAYMAKEDYLNLDIDYAEAGAKSTSLGEAFPSAKVILLFTEGENELRLSARSKNEFSVASLCNEFGGGGHHQAAGAVLKKDFDYQKIVREAKARLGL